MSTAVLMGTATAFALGFNIFVAATYSHAFSDWLDRLFFVVAFSVPEGMAIGGMAAGLAWFVSRFRRKWPRKGFYRITAWITYGLFVEALIVALNSFVFRLQRGRLIQLDLAIAGVAALGFLPFHRRVAAVLSRAAGVRRSW